MITFASLIENSKNNVTLRIFEPMTSISLKASLEVVHLTTIPLTHILFYRLEIVKKGQCSGTFTLGFLAGYEYVEFSSTLHWWSPLWFTGALLRPLLALSSVLHGSSPLRYAGALLCPSSGLSAELPSRSAVIGKLGKRGYLRRICQV